MGHIGLTPQTAVQLGGLKAQGRSAASAHRLLEEATALESAGCFSIVFEAIPAALTELLVPRLGVPVIGIGAGPATDGQVLVFHDLLGLLEGDGARFVKRYASLREQQVEAVKSYAEDVRSRTYPSSEHTYPMPDAELATFRTEIAE
jgi:3-methyl-2-oxobutanoate hydroxymethyltransferase